MRSHLWPILMNHVYLCLSCQGLYALCLLLERKIYFKRVKKHKPSCKNINLHFVLLMRDCFVSFILTFRNLCKSTLAYSPEFIMFYFLLTPYKLPKPLPKCQLWTIFFWCLESLFLPLHLIVKFQILRSQWQISHQLQHGFHPGCFHLSTCWLMSWLFFEISFQKHSSFRFESFTHTHTHTKPTEKQ